MLLLSQVFDRWRLSHVLLSNTLSMRVWQPYFVTLLSVKGSWRSLAGLRRHFRGVLLRSLPLLRSLLRRATSLVPIRIHLILVWVCCLVHMVLFESLLLWLTDSMVWVVPLDGTTCAENLFHNLLLILVRNRCLERILDFGTLPLIVCGASGHRPLGRCSACFSFRFVELGWSWNTRCHLRTVARLYCLLSWLSDRAQAWPSICSFMVQCTMDRLTSGHTRCLLLDIPGQ